MPHTVACRALGVSQSWFYKWRNRKPTTRQQRRAELDEAIQAAFDASGGTYGSPRVWLDLREAGWQVSVNTVAARMAALGLAGRAPKRRRGLTRQGKRPAAADLVARRFSAPAADVLWCGDMTEILTLTWAMVSGVIDSTTDDGASSWNVPSTDERVTYGSRMLLT